MPNENDNQGVDFKEGDRILVDLSGVEDTSFEVPDAAEAGLSQKLGRLRASHNRIRLARGHGFVVKNGQQTTLDRIRACRRPPEL